MREEIDEETDGLPLRERYGIVLLLILAAYVVAGFDQGRWVLAINSLLWVTVLLTTLWSPGIPRVLRRVDHHRDVADVLAPLHEVLADVDVEHRPER